jgi:hypothetical protein
VNLRFIKTTTCPICGCSQVASESIDVSSYADDPKYNTHCNGENWEHRKFVCGYAISYVPNFRAEEKTNDCKYNPTEAEKKMKRAKAKEKIIEFVYSTDCDSGFKDRIVEDIRYK